MEKTKKQQRMFVTVGLLSGGALIGVKNFAASLFNISEFAHGFVDGMAVTFALSGMIVLMLYLKKHDTL